MDSVAKKGYDTVYPQNFVKPFSFNEEDDKQIQIAGGETCNTFYPGYPYNKPWFEYDESTGEYLRFQFDDAQIDAETGEQLSYKTFLSNMLNRTIMKTEHRIIRWTEQARDCLLPTEKPCR